MPPNSDGISTDYAAKDRRWVFQRWSFLFGWGFAVLLVGNEDARTCRELLGRKHLRSALFYAVV